MYHVHTCSVSYDFSFISINMCFYSHLLLCVFYVLWCLRLTNHLLNEYDDDDDDVYNIIVMIW